MGSGETQCGTILDAAHARVSGPLGAVFFSLKLFFRPDLETLKGCFPRGLRLMESSQVCCHSIEAASPPSIGEPCERRAEEETGRRVRKGGLVIIPNLPPRISASKVPSHDWDRVAAPNLPV